MVCDLYRETIIKALQRCSGCPGQAGAQVENTGIRKNSLAWSRPASRQLRETTLQFAIHPATTSSFNSAHRRCSLHGVQLWDIRGSQHCEPEEQLIRQHEPKGSRCSALAFVSDVGLCPDFVDGTSQVRADLTIEQLTNTVPAFGMTTVCSTPTPSTHPTLMPFLRLPQ